MQNILLLLNAAFCGLSALRLMTYQRGLSQHNYFGSLIAYGLIVACGAVAIRIITGVHVKAEWDETLINMFLCIAVFAARGNVMKMVSRRN